MAGEPFDWKKIAAPENRPKWIVFFLAVIAAVYLVQTFAPGTPPAPGHGTASSGNGGGVLGGLLDGSAGRGAVPLDPLESGRCRTFAPAGWSVIDSNANGTAFTAASGDRSGIASYGGVAINSGQAQGLYGPQFTLPEALIQFAVSGLTNQNAQLQPGPAFGAYQTAQLQAGDYHGYVLYYRFFLAPDPGGYGLVMRIALARGDRHAVAEAGGVAAATRCQAVVIPQPIGNDTDRGSAHGAGTSKACAEQGSCDDSDLAGTYNTQLGTGWVHDSVGRNYNVDVTSDYDDNGPDGPGYYASVGGTREKLQPGLE